MDEQIDILQEIQTYLQMRDSPPTLNDNSLQDAYLIGFLRGQQMQQQSTVIISLAINQFDIIKQLNSLVETKQITTTEKQEKCEKLINNFDLIDSYLKDIPDKKSEFTENNSQSFQKSIIIFEGYQSKLKQVDPIELNQSIENQFEQSQQQENQVEIKQQVQNDQICTICVDSMHNQKIIPLRQCKHIFHVNCLIIYGKTQGVLPLKCPQHDCKCFIDEYDLFEIFDVETMEKLELQSLNKYLEEYFQCPTQGCLGLYKLDECSTVVICRLCQEAFCARCHKKFHDNEECQDEEFIKLVKTENYRQCQKCFRWIEKTFGCNHITCKCRHEFCYNCGKTWIARQECRCLKDEQMLRNRNIQQHLQRRRTGLEKVKQEINDGIEKISTEVKKGFKEVEKGFKQMKKFVKKRF